MVFWSRELFGTFEIFGGEDLSEGLEEFLEEYLHDGKYPLTEEQKDYVRDCVDKKKGHVINLSPAGFGKSVTLEALKAYLKDKLIICATTGIANSILFNNKGGDGTAHRVFSLSLGMFKDKDVSKVKSYCTGLFAPTDLVEYVVVEECGMLNPDQLELIRLRLERFNKPIKGKRKKRNIKLILLGDFLQLLPVLNQQDKNYLNSKYGSHLLFESEPFKKLDFIVHNFTKPLRTSEKTFQECLNVMRYGQEERYPNCIKWINKRHSWTLPEGLPLVTTTNKRVDEANSMAVRSNPEAPFSYKAKITGEFNMKDCPVDENLVLKKGLPVITLVNTDDYSNGSFGYVEECLSDGVFVHFPSIDETHFVDMFEFEQRESFLSTEKGEDGVEKAILDSKVIGRAVCLPVKVAAAFSIHRMQGRTLDVPAVVDISYKGFDMTDEDNDWGVNSAYVALSRFTSIDLIHLKYPLQHTGIKSHIKPHTKAIEWLSEKGIL